MEDQTTVARVNSVPAEISEILGPPPLLSTEDEKVYQAMMGCFAQSIGPRDLITWMLIRDLADHRTEIARLRRIKAGSIQYAVKTEMARRGAEVESKHRTEVARLRKEAGEKIQTTIKNKTIAEGQIDTFKAEVERQLAADSSASHTKAKQQLEELVAHRPTETDFVAVLDGWFYKVERIESQLHAAEKRFSGSLEEIDRHLHGLAWRLREEADRIIEGELIQPQSSSLELEGPANNGGLAGGLYADAISARFRELNSRGRVTGKPGKAGRGAC